MNVHFLVTHDVHSHLEAFIRAASLIESYREKWQAQGDVVLTIDLGDHMDRVHPATEGSLGLVNAHLLQAVKYDLWTFGNNEGLTIPQDIWPALIKEIGRKPLLANLIPAKGDFGQRHDLFDIHRIIDIQGVRMGFVGVTASFNEYYNLLGLVAEEPIGTVQREIEYLKNQQCDLIVVLSHCGLELDRRLAHAADGIDLILGSHTHRVLPHGEWMDATLICQGGKFAHYVVHASWNPQEGFCCELLEVPLSFEANSQCAEIERRLQNIYGEWESKAKQALDEIAGCLETSLPHHVVQPSPLGQWVADQIRLEDQVDAVILNQGLFGAGLLHKHVTFGDLHAACAAPINMVQVRLKGKELRILYESRDNPDIVLRQGIGFGFRGKEIGLLVVSGLTEMEGNLYVSEKLLEDQQEYTVAIADYLLFSRVFPGTENAIKVAIDSLFIRERMAAWLLKDL